MPPPLARLYLGKHLASLPPLSELRPAWWESRGALAIPDSGCLPWGWGMERGKEGRCRLSRQGAPGSGPLTLLLHHLCLVCTFGMFL